MVRMCGAGSQTIRGLNILSCQKHPEQKHPFLSLQKYSVRSKSRHVTHQKLTKSLSTSFIFSSEKQSKFYLERVGDCCFLL